MSLVLAAPQTDQLRAIADRANAEHAEALAAVRSALIHAINCGDALLEARPLVPEGRWMDWLRDNFDGSQASAQQYMRLAFYKEHILGAGEALQIKSAYTYLRGLPAIDGRARRGRRPPPPEEQVSEARRLREAGMTYDAIGEVLAMSGKTIRIWLNPQAGKTQNQAKRREYARRKAARLALQEKERAALVKKSGGAVAESYSLLRRTAQALDRAAQEAAAREDRAAIVDALQAVHTAEDHLVRALGIQHGHARARTINATRAAA